MTDLRIIGAGFGRTGTMSLKVALEMLGFAPCCHMIEVASREDRAALWLRAARGEPVDWRHVLRGFSATVDWPGAAFYRELLATFPGAKVILTTRDPESWYESVSKTIFERPSAQPEEPEDSISTRMVRAVVWQRSLKGRFDDKAATLDIFERHNREVVEAVPAGQLLTFEASDGWEPLCNFLDVPVPPAPYPRLNDAKMFNQGFDRLIEAYRSSVT